MAGTGRKTRSGPGRGTPRSRATSRSAALRTPNQAPAAALDPPQPETSPRDRVGFRLTRRAVVLLVIVAALAVMYASSLRVYFSQRFEIAQTREQIAQRDARIAELQDEIKRWEDPEYVKAQARARLGWVVPGEIGYRVIGPDGKLVGGGMELNSDSDSAKRKTWWQRLWGSVETADAPAKEDGDQQPSPEPTR